MPFHLHCVQGMRKECHTAKRPSKTFGRGKYGRTSSSLRLKRACCCFWAQYETSQFMRVPVKFCSTDELHRSCPQHVARGMLHNTSTHQEQHTNFYKPGRLHVLLKPWKLQTSSGPSAPCLLYQRRPVSAAQSDPLQLWVLPSTTPF